MMVTNVATGCSEVVDEQFPVYFELHHIKGELLRRGLEVELDMEWLDIEGETVATRSSHQVRLTGSDELEHGD